MKTRERDAQRMGMTIAVMAMDQPEGYAKKIYRIRRYGQPRRETTARQSGVELAPFTVDRELWKRACDRALEIHRARESFATRRRS